MTQAIRHALTYCRVSSKGQVLDGTGLESQFQRCREFAQNRDYDIVASFTDDMSGAIKSRPGFNSLLEFLNKRREPMYVIIDDISRLARGLETHTALRLKLARAGGILISPSVKFGEDSDSKLIENLLASVAQHAKEKNQEQTRNRIRGRMLGGYFTARAPVGYRYEKVEGHGKLLVRDEPAASLVREVYEGYERGRFQTFSEVVRFLRSQPGWPAKRRAHLTIERVRELLDRPVYTGHLHAPDKDIVMAPAKLSASSKTLGNSGFLTKSNTSGRYFVWLSMVKLLMTETTALEPPLRRFHFVFSMT